MASSAVTACSADMASGTYLEPPRTRSETIWRFNAIAEGTARTHHQTQSQPRRQTWQDQRMSSRMGTYVVLLLAWKNTVIKRMGCSVRQPRRQCSCLSWYSLIYLLLLCTRRKPIFILPPIDSRQSWWNLHLPNDNFTTPFIVNR